MNEQDHSGSEPLRKRHAAQHSSPNGWHLAGISLAETPANVRRIHQLREATEEILYMALRRNFFGAGALEFTVQDGTIQEVRQRLERIDR